MTAAASSDPMQNRASGERRRILDSLPTGARTTGEKAAARSRLVRRLRVAMPIVALVLIAAFIFNTRSKPVDQAFLDEFKDLSASTEELIMANPRFAGVDDKGKPFEITAESAMQRPGERNLVELKSPRAVQGQADEITVVTAEKGLYSSDKNILELLESVTLEHKLGSEIYVLRSPAATVSIDNETVTSDVGVGGTGPDGGMLKADRMKAYHGDGRVVFEGNVSMRIYPDSPALRGGDADKDETEVNN